MKLIFAVMIFAASCINLQGADLSVIIATESNMSKCVVLLDSSGHMLRSCYVNDKSPADSFEWSPSDKRTIHCLIELSPFSLTIRSTNYGNSLMIMRGDKLADIANINYGLHGSSSGYAAILKVEASKLPESLRSVNYDLLTKVAESP